VTIPSFEEYLDSLSNLATVNDPTLLNAEGAALKVAANAISALPDVSAVALAALIQEHPEYVPALGLAVGLSKEGLRNTLRHHLGTSGHVTLARKHPDSIIAMLDGEYDLLRLVEKQRGPSYDFGDLLVARAGARTTAANAGRRGRRIEDEIEAVARDLGLPCETRTRFEGRGGGGPCDLAIPSGGNAAKIVVAAKGFNSTGSKLTDAVTEIERMAEVRMPTQFVFAAIDGIGWKSRQADLRRIHRLWVDRRIDGMFSLSTLDQFRAELENAARRLGLLS
jgi:hypothetical protein